MCCFNFVCLLVFIVKTSSSPVSPHYKYEEYVIEHEISATQAKNTVLSIDLNKFTIPAGCQKCTQTEINYCLSKHLIEDHCCCDKRYHEDLSFVPHTCYLGPQLCTTYFRDCIEYSRLRKCCCDFYVIKKWKDKSSGNNNIFNSAIIIFMFLFVNLLNFSNDVLYL